VSYKYYIKNRGDGYGNLIFKKERFPSEAFISIEAEKKVRNLFPLSSDKNSVKTITLNIFEFKNEEDYKNYLNEN
jgi:hypothetical protein